MRKSAHQLGGMNTVNFIQRTCGLTSCTWPISAARQFKAIWIRSAIILHVSVLTSCQGQNLNYGIEIDTPKTNNGNRNSVERETKRGTEALFSENKSECEIARTIGKSKTAVHNYKADILRRSAQKAGFQVPIITTRTSPADPRFPWWPILRS